MVFSLKNTKQPPTSQLEQHAQGVAWLIRLREIIRRNTKSNAHHTSNNFLFQTMTSKRVAVAGPSSSATVQFSSTVTIRKCSHNSPQSNETPYPPLPMTQTQDSTSIASTEGGIPHDRRVQQRISIAAVLSFQDHLRKQTKDPSTHSDLLCSVSSKFSQRARDLALEHGRQLFCEVHQPAKGSVVLMPFQISKFPAFKRKSKNEAGANVRLEQKKRRVTID